MKRCKVWSGLKVHFRLDSPISGLLTIFQSFARNAGVLPPEVWGNIISMAGIAMPIRVLCKSWDVVTSSCHKHKQRHILKGALTCNDSHVTLPSLYPRSQQRIFVLVRNHADCKSEDIGKLKTKHSTDSSSYFSLTSQLWLCRLVSPAWPAWPWPPTARRNAQLSLTWPLPGLAWAPQYTKTIIRKWRKAAYLHQFCTYCIANTQGGEDQCI